MAYTVTNFKTKKSLREALVQGDIIHVFQPGPWGPEVKDGTVYLEGPHYPKPHKWWGSVTVKDGVIVGEKVK
jgi:hypothetical protein